MKYTEDLVNEMKRMNFQHDGTIISDQEAEEAWDRLCEFFDLLNEIDKREGVTPFIRET